MLFLSQAVKAAQSVMLFVLRWRAATPAHILLEGAYCLNRLDK